MDKEKNKTYSNLPCAGKNISMQSWNRSQRYSSRCKRNQTHTLKLRNSCHSSDGSHCDDWFDLIRFKQSSQACKCRLSSYKIYKSRVRILPHGLKSLVYTDLRVQMRSHTDRALYGWFQSGVWRQRENEGFLAMANRASKLLGFRV